MSIASALTANAEFEWRRGTLDFAGRALSIGGDMLIAGGAGLTYAGSTVTFAGTSTQTVHFTSLDGVIVDNPSPVRLAFNSTWGNFTVNPGRYFDGTLRRLTIVGDRWSTAGAVYGSLTQQHTVVWLPPASITVAAGSVVNAKVVISTGVAAILQGGLIIEGGGNTLDPQPGAVVLNAAGGSTITFRGSSDLAPSAGAGWSYAGDAANSWLVFEGTGLARGAFFFTSRAFSDSCGIESKPKSFCGGLFGSSKVLARYTLKRCFQNRCSITLRISFNG